jgi:hypothetical protein
LQAEALELVAQVGDGLFLAVAARLPAAELVGGEHADVRGKSSAEISGPKACPACSFAETARLRLLHGIVLAGRRRAKERPGPPRKAAGN